MKVLLINCTSECSNYAYYTKGHDAVFSGTIKTLKSYFPDATFSTLMYCPPKSSDRLNITTFQKKDLNHLRPFSIIDTVRSSVDFSLAAIWCAFDRLFNSQLDFLINDGKLRCYRDSDLIIHLGGDLYSDEKGLITLIEHSKDLIMSRMLRKPVIVYAETLGPFRSRLGRWLARFTLNRVSLITLRENFSKANITKINVAVPPIHVTADPAFLFDPPSPQRTESILHEIGCVNCSPLIGLIISDDIYVKGHARLFNRAKFFYSFAQFILPERLLFSLLNSKLVSKGRIDVINYVAKVGASITNYLIEEFDATVILIPNATNILFDINVINRKIFELTKRKDKIKIINYETYSGQEIKGIIGKCDLFVGSKMHACIAAWSQCIPAVALSSSHKYYGVVLPICQEHYVCDTPAELFPKIREALNKREEIKQELACKIPDAINLALKNGALIKEHVKGKH